jgi:hypothetical protein
MFVTMRVRRSNVEIGPEHTAHEFDDGNMTHVLNFRGNIMGGIRRAHQTFHSVVLGKGLPGRRVCAFRG